MGHLQLLSQDHLQGTELESKQLGIDKIRGSLNYCTIMQISPLVLFKIHTYFLHRGGIVAWKLGSSLMMSASHVGVLVPITSTPLGDGPMWVTHGRLGSPF